MKDLKGISKIRMKVLYLINGFLSFTSFSSSKMLKKFVFFLQIRRGLLFRATHIERLVCNFAHKKDLETKLKSHLYLARLEIPILDSQIVLKQFEHFQNTKV